MSHFANETEARVHLAEVGGYIWPFEANGKQRFQVVTIGTAVELLAGVDGDGRAVAERALESAEANAAGLNSKSPPVLYGPLVAEILKAGRKALAVEQAAAEPEPRETAAEFLTRVRVLTGADFEHWPHETDAERIWDGRMLCKRGNVFMITMIDDNGVNRAPIGKSGIFAVETEPGAIKALLAEANTDLGPR